MAFGTWMKRIKEGFQNVGNKIKEAFTGKKKEEEQQKPVAPPPSKIDFKPWLEHEAKVGLRNWSQDDLEKFKIGSKI